MHPHEWNEMELQSFLTKKVVSVSALQDKIVHMKVFTKKVMNFTKVGFPLEVFFCPLGF